MNWANALSQANTEILAVAATNTSTLTGTAVDVTLYEGIGAVVLNTAKGTGTTPTLDGKLQSGAESDGSDAADISGATFTQVTDAADSLQVLSVDLSAAGKYLRFVGTITGTSPSFVLGVSLVGIKKST